MDAIALLGGPKEQWPIDIKKKLLKAKEKNHLIFTSDRGSLFLLEMGIIPDIAVGDFDSLTASELNLIENKVKDIRYSHPVKNLTDSELLFRTALEDYHISHLKIYGATGGRLDHMLVNILTFVNFPLSEYCNNIEFIDIQNKIKLFNPGVYDLYEKNDYNYLGIGNLTQIENLSIKGAKYYLSNYCSKFPKMFSSNEFLENKKITISLELGIVIVIYCKDIDKFSNLS